MTLTNLIDLSGLSEFYTQLKANGANQIKYSESKTLKEAIDDAAKLEFTVIPDFPNNPDTRHIYLKANNSGQTNNIYDEYIWTGTVFEKFGTTELNLSGYATTSSLAAVATSGSYTDLSDKPTTFGASGSNHSPGLVPDPGATAGSTKFLREDGTWQTVSGGDRTTYFATCSTAAATAAKVIDVTLDSEESFLLKKGTTIIVTFSNTNTASNPTFSVAGTAATPIEYNGAIVTTNNLGGGGIKNNNMMFIYDGSSWVYVTKNVDLNTTYSKMSESEAKTGTDTTARSITAEVLSKAAKGFVTATSGATPTVASLKAGEHQVFGTVTSLTITALAAPTSGVVNEYSFEFDSGSTPATITLPTTNMVWQDAPSCNANCHYEVNIKYNATTGKYYGLWAEWEA